MRNESRICYSYLDFSRIILTRTSNYCEVGSSYRMVSLFISDRFLNGRSLFELRIIERHCVEI